MADKKYYVAAKKSVTTRVGIKGEGVEVNKKMLGVDSKRMDVLVEKEILTNEKPDVRTKAEIVTERNLEKKNKKDAKDIAARKLREVTVSAHKAGIEVPKNATFEVIEKLIADKAKSDKSEEAKKLKDLLEVAKKAGITVPKDSTIEAIEKLIADKAEADKKAEENK